jgi:hypothetical protein
MVDDKDQPEPRKYTATEPFLSPPVTLPKPRALLPDEHQVDPWTSLHLLHNRSS